MQMGTDEDARREAREERQVDRRLRQLEKARARAADARRRRREEEERGKWDRLRADLRLSGLEESLLRLMDRAAERHRPPTVGDVVKAIWRVRWGRLGKNRRARYLGALRGLLHRLNRKLSGVGPAATHHHRQRVALSGGRLRVVDAGRWKKRAGARGQAGYEDVRRRGGRAAVADCVRCLRNLLTGKAHVPLEDGWLPSVTLHQTARAWGFRSGTIKAARKRLRLQCRRVGFGGGGAWMVRLPDRGRAKT